VYKEEVRHFRIFQGTVMQQQGLGLQKYFSLSNEIEQTVKDQYFYGHGKLLLSGEYFVLDGAKALGLPTSVGQSLSVKYSSSFNPKLYWKSYDPSGQLWFHATYEFWHFNIIEENPAPEAVVLQQVLRQVREQNAHFLREDVDVQVTTQLGFPLDWGLGSSSTLIHNIADWAYVSPFELLFNTLGGSGYDIACAQSDGPIVYQKTLEGPNWSPTLFDPPFKDNLYFIYLDKKQNSRQAIEDYNSKKPHPPHIIKSISDITDQMVSCTSLEEFNFLMAEHESIVGKTLNMTPVKDKFFSDFRGSIKSLGAWGGDFILAATSESSDYVNQYFLDKGLKVIIPYRELILDPAAGMDNNKNVH
jgi:mevalonate kinase